MTEPDRTDLYAWARYLKSIKNDADAAYALASFRDHWLRSHGEQLISMMQLHFLDIVHSTRAASLLLPFQQKEMK